MRPGDRIKIAAIILFFLRHGSGRRRDRVEEPVAALLGGAEAGDIEFC